MTIGSGIAIAAIWIVTGIICLHRTVLGLGMTMALIAACVATFYVAGATQ